LQQAAQADQLYFFIIVGEGRMIRSIHVKCSARTGMTTLPSQYRDRCESLKQTPGILYQEGMLAGVGAVDLYYQAWFPRESPRAAVVLIHGMGGHAGLLGNVIDHLVRQELAVFTWDLRGHGLSSGQRGFILDWAEFRSDLDTILQFVHIQLPDSPRFLVGHSLGSIIALDYVLHAPDAVQGVVAISPPLGQIELSPLKLRLATLLSKIWPRFSLNSGVDPDVGSRDPAVNAAYCQDPLRHTRGTARLATEFFKTVAWVKEHAGDLQTPLLILHGGCDRFVLPEGGRTFFEQVRFADKEYLEYPDAYHELQNDLNYGQVLNDMTTWINRHLGAGAEQSPYSAPSQEYS
jgi:alpha-beta hydrolase superfamily lysophospholipase